MANKRLEKIKELISKNDISTQEMLADLLNKEGYEVTQATVSRDIKKLGLTKSFENGVNKYVLKSNYTDKHNYLILRNEILSVVPAQNIVVIKCKTGLANAVCVFLDELEHDGIVGTLAGDDTVFIATTDNSAALSIVKMLSTKLF